MVKWNYRAKEEYGGMHDTSEGYPLQGRVEIRIAGIRSMQRRGGAKLVMGGRGVEARVARGRLSPAVGGVGGAAEERAAS